MLTTRTLDYESDSPCPQRIPVLSVRFLTALTPHRGQWTILTPHGRLRLDQVEDMSNNLACKAAGGGWWWTPSECTMMKIKAEADKAAEEARRDLAKERRQAAQVGHHGSADKEDTYFNNRQPTTR